MTSSMMITSVISLAVGLVIPALTALITKEQVSDNLKLLLNALLAAVSGALTGALTALPHGWHQWEPIAWNIALAWVAAVVTFATHFSPVGSTKWIASKTANFGLGTSVPAGDAGYGRIPLFLASVLAGAAMFAGMSIPASGLPILHLAAVLVIATVVSTAAAAAVILCLLARAQREAERARWIASRRPPSTAHAPYPTGREPAR